MIHGADGTARGRWSRGQGTLEYALVLFAFIASIMSLGLIWHGVRDGALLRQAVRSASHALSGTDPVGSSKDLLLF